MVRALPAAPAPAQEDPRPLKAAIYQSLRSAALALRSTLDARHTTAATIHNEKREVRSEEALVSNCVSVYSTYLLGDNHS
jgi:hypothetical protein